MQNFHMFIQCFNCSTCSISTCIYVSTIPRAVFPCVYMFLLFHVQYFHVYICFYYSTCSISTVYMFLLFHVQYFHVYICFYYSTCSISTRWRRWTTGWRPPCPTCISRSHVRAWPVTPLTWRTSGQKWRYVGREGEGSSETSNMDILSISFYVIISSNRAKHTTLLQWKMYVHL